MNANPPVFEFIAVLMALFFLGLAFAVVMRKLLEANRLQQETRDGWLWMDRGGKRGK